MSALMTIIIKAIDKSSEVAQKISNKMKDVGDQTAKALDRASAAGDKFTESIKKTSTVGISSYAQLSSKQQEYLQGLSKGQGLLDRMGLSGTKMGNAISSGYDKVQNVINRVKSGVETLKSKIESTTVGNKLITGFNAVESKVRQVGSTISSALSKGLDTAKTKVEALNNSLGQLGQGVATVFGALGLGSIYQATIGLGMAREQMTTLMTATMQSSSAAKEFVTTLDTMTNSSLVSLNDLGKAMANIKMSTGMTNDQLKLVAPTVNDIGQRALLMGADAGQAQDLMTASMRGLNGEFDMLKTNFGITKKSLTDAGWSGASTDVAGYNAALQKVLARGGDMNGMLASTPGQIKLVEKGFSTAGRQIGEIFLPAIKTFLEFMVGLKATNPVVFKIVIVIGALISVFALLLPVMGFMIGSFKSFLMFLQLIPAAENAITLSTARTTAATWLSTAANSAKTAALGVLSAAQSVYATVTGASLGVTEASVGAAIAHAGATNVNTAAVNTGTLASIRMGASYILQRGVMLAGAAATTIMTAAQAALNVVMSMNPIAIVIIAIVALIAILAYLYNKNETVRNAINWLWNGLKQLGGYIMGGLMVAWTALTAALQPINDALGRLWAAISKVWNAFAGGKSAQANSTFNQITSAASGLWTIISKLVSLIISGLTPVWKALLPILIAVANIITGFLGASFRTIFGIIGAVIGFVARFINILADLISGNITFGQAMGQIWESFKIMILGILISITTGLGGFFLDLAVKGIAAVTAFVINFAAFLMQLPLKVAFALGFVIGTIFRWGQELGTYARTTSVAFVNNFITFLMSLPGRVWTFLALSLIKVTLWKNQLIAHARQSGSQMVSNFISFIQSLPGRVWSFLLSTISRIISFASRASSTARQAGSNVVNGIKNAIAVLPSVVWDEMMAIGHAITSAGSQLYQYASDVGNQIVNGIKAGANIHSPGDAYKAIKGELDLMGEAMDKAKDKLGKKASDIGSSITDKFKSNLTQPTIPLPTSTTTTAQPSAVTASSGAVASAGVNIDVPGLQAQTAAAQVIVAGSVATVSGQYNLLRTNTGTSWTAMVNTQKTSLTSMKANMATTLNSIVATNKSGYTSLQNTTQSVLSNLKTKTNDNITSVKGSWNGMRDSLVKAADKIKSNVGGDISNLSSNIGTFYRKVSNPSLFLAGPGPRSGYAGPGKIRIPNISGSGFAGHNNTSNRSNLNKLDTVTLPCLEPPCYAGWTDLKPNTNDIIGKVDNYGTTFPPYSFNKDVGDFTNTSMPIMGDFSAFESIAGNMIDKTAYQFYYNSKGGSPRSIYDSGSFNCWDGALIMLSLANSLGLSGYMAHGMWGNVGHAWAVIENHNMDTTARQDGYGWTSPKVTGYAGIKTKDYGQMLSENPTNNEPLLIKFENELKHKHEINLTGIPEHMDTAELKAIFDEMTKDPEFIKAFVNKQDFIDYLSIAWARKKAAKERQYGRRT